MLAKFQFGVRQHRAGSRTRTRQFEGDLLGVWPWPPWPTWPPVRECFHDKRSIVVSVRHLTPPTRQLEDIFFKSGDRGVAASTIGRESPRPTANPVLMSGYPRGSASPRWRGIRVSVWLPHGPRPYRPSGPLLPTKTCVRVHLCKPATRRRGLTQECGLASGRTRAVSACTTRTTRLARSRKRALPTGAQQ